MAAWSDGLLVAGRHISCDATSHSFLREIPQCWLTGQAAGAAWVFVRPVFAETLGKANCYGQSFAALAEQYGGLINAAAALGFDSVKALQAAIQGFCEG